MTYRTVDQWLGVIQAERHDDNLSRFLLADLTGYRFSDSYTDDDLQSVLALFAALRIHQVGGRAA